jgi:hypothetical protein
MILLYHPWANTQRKVSIQQRYLCTCVYCSTIDNSQVMGSAYMPIYG